MAAGAGPSTKCRPVALSRPRFSTWPYLVSHNKWSNGLGTAAEGGPAPQAGCGLAGPEAASRPPQPPFARGRGLLLGFIGSWLPAQLWGYQTTNLFFFTGSLNPNLGQSVLKHGSGVSRPQPVPLWTPLAAGQGAPAFPAQIVPFPSTVLTERRHRELPRGHRWPGDCRGRGSGKVRRGGQEETAGRSGWVSRDAASEGGSRASVAREILRGARNPADAGLLRGVWSARRPREFSAGPRVPHGSGTQTRVCLVPLPRPLPPPTGCQERWPQNEN